MEMGLHLFYIKFYRKQAIRMIIVLKPGVTR